MKLFAQVLAALDEGRGVALATVIATRGSTPRHVGARMAVADDGRTMGTIGGGRIEAEVVAAASAVAAGGPARRLEHHLVRDLAMCCGGSMELVIAPAAPSRLALADALGAWRRREPAVLSTALVDAPAGALGSMTFAPASAAEAAAWRRPTVDGGALREGVAAPERAILFGCGHVARALGGLLAPLGFEVVVCDDGDTGALVSPPPWADRVIESFAVADVERGIGPLGAADHVLIITRDHAVDQRLLEALVGHDLGYLGMIGSRGKVGRFRKRLEAKGLDLSRWDRLHAPIGLDLGAETPEEIAIAIAAELVALRRRGAAEAGTWGTPAARRGAVVLAAGAGTRLGGVAKALLRDGDRSFLAKIVATAAAAGVAPRDVVVVVGPPFAEVVAAEAVALGATVVSNPAPERGMASSVALGFAAAAAEPAITAAFLWPVDHPHVTPSTVVTLAARGEGVPAAGDRGGHPPLVPRRLFAALVACAEMPGGAREIVRTLARVPVDDAGVIEDIDHPADLVRAC